MMEMEMEVGGRHPQIEHPLGWNGPPQDGGTLLGCWGPPKGRGGRAQHGDGGGQPPNKPPGVGGEHWGPPLTLTSVTAMSTTLPTTIRASKLFQASQK